MKLEFRVATFISLVLILCIGGSNRYVWCYQGPQGVRFTYTPFADFYEGQPFEFTCEAGTGNGTSYENALPQNKPLAIHLVFNSTVYSSKRVLGCYFDGNPGSTTSDTGPRELQWSSLTSEDCGNRDKELERIIVTGNITQAMQSNYSDFSCETLYTVGGKIETKISKERLHLIPELKVAPQNLTITLSDVVEEGKRLIFSCESVEGKPSSNFTYKIQRNSDNLPSDLEDTFYVPNRQDREGINISCTDQSHINYPGPNTNIIEWMYVEPQYLEFKRGYENKTATVKVSSILTPTYNLSCGDVFLSSPNLSHVWIYNGVKQGEDEETLTLNTSTLKDDDKIVCLASFKLGETAEEYTWLFTKPISDSADDLPWIPWVLGSVAVGAVVVFAVVLVLCCNQKQQRQNRTGNRESPTGTHSPKSKGRRRRRKIGVNGLSPADQPNQMDTTRINQLLQQQSLHNQERQPLQEELEAKEQILNAAQQRGEN